MRPNIGAKIELYNGSGVWGYSDGVVTEITADENVVVRFTPRPPAVGEDFTTVHSMQRWDALVADGYLTIKEPN